MPLRTPLTFSPQFQDYIWGGRNLATVLGRPIPDGVVAESWEVSSHPAAPTRVDEGPLMGHSLIGLVAEHGAALVGRRGADAVDRGQFPLLIKLLDANRALSVQVHPDDEQQQNEGRREGHGFGGLDVRGLHGNVKNVETEVHELPIQV